MQPLMHQKSANRPLKLLRILLAGAVAALIASAALASTDEPADLVVLNANIYTADRAHSLAGGIAVRNGKIVFVGTSDQARRHIGKTTQVRDLAGRTVLPGLYDSHLHPIAMIKVDGCDLGNQGRTLLQISDFVRGCLARFPVQSGGWLSVHQWNPSVGNQPDATLPTLVKALDRVSTHIAIQLIGSDGHHGAFNSTGLARAKNASGKTVGYTKASLAQGFSAYRKVIGVDADGNPNGAVNEDAKALMGAPGILTVDFDQRIKARAQLPQLLNSAGITGILDAKAAPPLMALYDLLSEEHRLTFRVNLAQFYDPDQAKIPNGHTDYRSLLAQAKSIRAKYANNPLIRADIVKLFADGVLEGNPYAVPPTLPNTLSLHPYLQPIFGKDAAGQLTVTGYVDTGSAACREIRAHPDTYNDAAVIQHFIQVNAFHPGQCVVSSGQLRHDRGTIMEFVGQFHRAGFALHIHAIGDGSVATAIDAIEAARASDGVSTQHDGLAHVQLAQPSDVARIGRDHLYVAFTYSWARADQQYDLGVVPFIDRVIGNEYSALHSARGYYEANAYPANSVLRAGGILVAGSDAPVDTADPQPFVNMAAAVTRRAPGGKPQSPQQAIGIRDVIDAYTVNGARFLKRDSEAGSIEIGKSADFIVLDRNILALADDNSGDEIAGTQVLETWFQGKSVFVRPTR